MKKILIIIPLIILVFAGCELLDHDPYDDQKIEDLFDQLTTAFENVNTDDVSTVMALYDSHYFNDLKDYYAIEEFYLQLFQTYGEELDFSVNLNDYNEILEVEWTLTVNYTNNDTAFAETFLFEDILIERDGQYLFYGNQVDPPELDPTKPVVFVEYGTAVSCGNCPPASAELHHMGLEYGAQFIYLTYCFNEPFDPYVEFATYYNEQAQPVSIFGGQYKIVGASEEDIQEFGQRYDQIVSGSPEAFLNNITFTDSGEMIDGTVEVDLQGVSTASLVLKAALVDERSELFYNNGGGRMYNVLFAIGEEDVAGSGTVEFRIDYDLPSYSDTMPENTKLVLWLQTREATYNPATCKVHTAAEIDLF